MRRYSGCRRSITNKWKIDFERGIVIDRDREMRYNESVPKGHGKEELYENYQRFRAVC